MKESVLRRSVVVVVVVYPGEVGGKVLGDAVEYHNTTIQFFF